MKPVVTWILVADGAQAKVFEHLGPGKGLQAVSDAQFAQTPLRAGEIMSDRPGRSFSSVGSGRSAMEPTTDPVADRERRFVADVAAFLDSRLAAGDFQRLVIAAAPTALGDLRGSLTPKLEAAVMAELPRDFTGQRTEALERHLADVLAI